MAAIDVLADLGLSTGPLIVSKKAIYEQARNTRLIGRFMSHGGVDDYFQGGVQVKDQIHLSGINRTQPYGFGDEWSYPMDDTLSEWTARWRFDYTSVTFSEHEERLQGIEQKSKMWRQQTYKDILDVKFAPVEHDFADFQEKSLWRQPVYSEMEAAAGKRRYSLPLFANEFTNAIPPGWTGNNIQNLDSTEAAWQPYIETYSDQVGITWSLWPALSRLTRKMQYAPLESADKYSEGVQSQSPWFIATSGPGHDYYEEGLRLRGNSWTQNSMTLNYNGAPVLWVQDLDTAAIYPGTSGTVFAPEMDSVTGIDNDGSSNTTNPDNSGPRYWVINGNYLKPYWHRDYLRKMHPYFTPDERPYLRVLPIERWSNTICRSRKRAVGIVAPTGSVYTS